MELGTARAVPSIAGLTPMEIATSVLLGRAGSGKGAAEEPFGGRAREVLERALLRALLRPPCLVSFSGGRDSSALLAVACHLARREGLPKPVPVTTVWEEVAETKEDEWQRRVIDHLGLTEWVRRTFDHELDLVGPVARRLMTAHGVPYPDNLHLQVPLLEEARGGSLVTGVGGDEALSAASRELAVLTLRVRPRRRDALRVAAALAPRPVRRVGLARRYGLAFPWLRPEANAAFGRAWLDDLLRIPLRWNARLLEWRRARYVDRLLSSMATIGAEADVEFCHPFSDEAFVTALAAEGGARGFLTRGAAMEALFSDVLPPESVRRKTKASFDGALWNRHSRAFASDLDGNGLERALSLLHVDDLVDASALAEEWAQPAPSGNSFLLLQACWVAVNPRSGDALRPQSAVDSDAR